MPVIEVLDDQNGTRRMADVPPFERGIPIEKYNPLRRIAGDEQQPEELPTQVRKPASKQQSLFGGGGQ